MSIEPGAPGRTEVMVLSQRGHGDDGHTSVAGIPAHCVEEGEAVHDRHDENAQNQIRGRLPKAVEGFLAISRGEDPQPEGIEHLTQELTTVLMVFELFQRTVGNAPRPRRQPYLDRNDVSRC
jgi:hypothetical protein